VPLTGPTIFHTSSAGDGRRTWGELKRELARPVNDNDDGVLATAGDCLTSAVRTLNRFIWPHERTQVDITIVSGTETYALPSAFKREMAGYLLDGVGGRPTQRLVHMGIEEMLGSYSLKVGGKPTLYFFQNIHETGQVTFLPRADSDYYARLWYYKRSGSRYNDAEIPDWDEEFEEVVQQYAWMEMVKRMPGSENQGKLADARRAAAQARAELVQAVTSRGDSVGIA